MKKVFELRELDCANCARKMEEAVAKLTGVEEVKVNFLSQKMTIAIADGEFDSVMKQVVKVCKRVEPDCEIVL